MHSELVWFSTLIGQKKGSLDNSHVFFCQCSLYTFCTADLTEILEKIHFFSFYTAFYAPIGVKNIVLSYERENVIEFHTYWKSN